jgi:hypothetical protein
MELAPACERALASLPPTPARAALLAAVRELDRGALPSLEALDPERRFLIAFALSLLRPPLFESMEIACAPYGLVQNIALERWVERMEHVSIDLVSRMLEEHEGGGAVAANAVARLLGDGRTEDALRLARTIGRRHKLSRALALVEIGLALGDDAVLAEAVAVVVDTRVIQTGGYTELEVLVAMLERMRALDPEHPSVRRIVKHARSIGGRVHDHPVAYAELLARAARSCASYGPKWLATAHELRAKILLDDIARTTDAALAAPDPASPIEPLGWKIEGRLPKDDAWRMVAELPERAEEASAVLADALDHGDHERFFEALGIALDPAGVTYEERLAAWRSAPTDAALVELVRHDPTPPKWWCAKSPPDVWEAIATISSAAAKDAVVALLFERDMASRAFGEHRAPRAIGVSLASLVVRFDDASLERRLLTSLVETTRPGAAYRLFATLEVLLSAGRRPQIELPDDRRWAAWAQASLYPELSVDGLRARFGELPRAGIHGVARVLARAGRFDDALMISEHESKYFVGVIETGAETRPPPTWDSVLVIAEAAPGLDAAQKKRLRAMFKKAPRGRDAGSQSQYKTDRARLDELLGS